MPEDLKEQVPYVLKICEAFRIPVLSFEKYEADDVIGTLARRAEASGLDVVIVTIDKDMFQLVSPQTAVLDTRAMKRYDPKGVEEKLGVRPDQVVDVLSLVGDSSVVINHRVDKCVRTLEVGVGCVENGLPTTRPRALLRSQT